jgi:hypothetical protein
MENSVLTGRKVREKQVLLFMPLVVVPLLALLFYVGGGGRGREAMVMAAGFLKRLPGAVVGPVTRLDKMGYYELAKRDSVAARQRMVIQSHYARQLGFGDADSNVRRVKEKLKVLKRVVGGGAATRMVAAPAMGTVAASIAGMAVAREPLRRPEEMGRLEQVMRVLQRDEGGSAEMRELSGVVEKLLVLQRGQADTGRKVVARSVGQVVLAVRALPEEEDTLGGFDSSRIEATAPEEAVLMSGGELRMELVGDVLIGRQRVPAGTPVFGTVSLSGERLRVAIGAIACGGRVLPVALEVEDEDGMPGIYIPGAPVSEALRESAGQELGSLGSGVVSTTLGGQAAGAGVVLARSLIGKKIRPVKVTVPAGYRVFLHVKNLGL